MGPRQERDPQAERGTDGESSSRFQSLLILIAKSIEPPCIPRRDPIIKITDIVIPTDRTDITKATTFDLDLYRELLAEARVTVAGSRAFKFVRPRMDDGY